MSKEFDPQKVEWRTYRKLPNNGWAQDGHFWSIRHSKEMEKVLRDATIKLFVKYAG